MLCLYFFLLLDDILCAFVYVCVCVSSVSKELLLPPYIFIVFSLDMTVT